MKAEKDSFKIPAIHDGLHTMRYFPRPRLPAFSMVFGLVVFLTLASCSDNEHASAYTPVVDLDIPDPVLKACVVAEAKRNGWKTSGQMTELVCANPEGEQITILDGVEDLINLQVLDLAHNAISDVHSIDYLGRLAQLDLGYNNIQYVGFSRIRISLKSLNLDHNQISDISWLASLRHVEQVSLSHNRLTSIEALASLSDLVSLDARNNQISSISSLTSNRELREVDLGNNLITDVGGLRENLHLVVLRLDGNQISNIDGLAGLEDLEELNLANNQLTDVSTLAEDLSIQRLNLSHNQIEDVMPLELLGAVESVNVTGNPVSCESIERLVAALGKDTVLADDCAGTNKLQ